MASDLPGPEVRQTWQELLQAELGVDSAAREAYSPRRVRPRHRMIVMMAEAGLKQRDIAKAVGMTESRVSVILNSRNPRLQQIRAKFASDVADNVKDVAARIRLYANEMLDVMVFHARNKDNATDSRLAARDILHMAGFTPVKKELQLKAEAPLEELVRVMKPIQQANEVVLRREEWEIKDV